MTHTKGPWNLDDGLRTVEGRDAWGNWRTICSPVRGGSPEEADFNARLIAAAPDLLAAAKAAIHEMCRTTAPRTSFTDTVDMLDAAITKAEKLNP